MGSRSQTQASSPSIVWAYGLGIFGVAAFGATLPVTRIALQDFSPEFLTFARAVIATLMAAATLKILNKPLYHKDNIQIFIAGIFLIFTFPGFMSIAMQTVPASYGGVVLGFLPITTAILARILTDEKPSMRFWLLSITGCAIVVGFILIKAETYEGAGTWTGYAWLVLSGLTASLGYVMFGKLSRETPGWEIISRSLILNLPLTVFGLVWFYETTNLNPGFAGLSSLIYLGSFSMFLAFCAWNAALAIGGIAKIGQLQLLQVFVTIAIAAVLLGEPIDAFTLTTACVVTAIIAFTRNA
ncbi:MAG: DMT family transporter [Pseudomonadota bacterium]